MPNSEPARVSLERCPFCGGEASADGYIRHSRPLADVWWPDGSPVTEAFYVNCMPCGAVSRSGLAGGYRTRAEAITAWNRRTPPASPGWQDYERGIEDAVKAVESMPVVINFAPPKGLSIMDATRADIATAIRALKSPAAPEQQP